MSEMFGVLWEQWLWAQFLFGKMNLFYFFALDNKAKLSEGAATLKKSAVSEEQNDLRVWVMFPLLLSVRYGVKLKKLIQVMQFNIY